MAIASGWNATCCIQDVRVSLKSATTNSASSSAKSAKEAGPSFLSLLFAPPRDASVARHSGETYSQNHSQSETVESHEAAAQTRNTTATNDQGSTGTRSIGSLKTKLSQAQQGSADGAKPETSENRISSGPAKSRKSTDRVGDSRTRENSQRNSDSVKTAASTNPVVCDGAQQMLVAQPQSSVEGTAGAGPLEPGSGKDDPSRAVIAESLVDVSVDVVNRPFSQANELGGLIAASNIDSAQATANPSDVLAADTVQRDGGEPTLTANEATLAVNAELSALMTPESVPEPGSSEGLSKDIGIRSILDKAKSGRTLNSNLAGRTAAEASSESNSQQNAISSSNDTSLSAQSLSQQISDDSRLKKTGAQTSEGGGTSTISFVTHLSGGQNGIADRSTITTNHAALPGQAEVNTFPDEVNGGGWTGTQGMSTAKLIQTMSETEMRVGMHSNEFGDISIRTSVSQQQVRAQILVDHSELGKAISAHLLSVQTKLGEDFGLHAKIVVNETAGSLSGGHGETSQRNTGTNSQSRRVDSAVSVAEIGVKAVSPILHSMNDGRLDIRA